MTDTIDSMSYHHLIELLATLPKAPPNITIHATPFWPQEYSHTITKHYQAHPLILFLAKYLPITPYVEAKHRIYKDAPALLDVRTGRLYCSTAQQAALRTTLATGRDTQENLSRLRPYGPRIF